VIHIPARISEDGQRTVIRHSIGSECGIGTHPRHVGRADRGRGSAPTVAHIGEHLGDLRVVELAAVSDFTIGESAMDGNNSAIPLPSMP
jgi:hypothetical protein